MGMYTGLRINGTIKPEYRQDIRLLVVVGWESAWETLAEFKTVYKDLASRPRCNMIPFGALSYMPDSWREHSHSYDNSTGKWSFSCSLKNYNSEIQAFLKMVPEIFEELEFCEYYYEEWDTSKIFVLENGELIEKTGIVYDEYLLDEIKEWESRG